MKFEIKNPFAKKTPVSDKELDELRKTLRKSQREFDDQSRRYEAQMAELRELVGKAALLEKDSAEYKELKMKAVACKQKADTYQKGMKASLAVLEKNRQFENMLENGMTLARLQEMLPDPERAEKLLQKISDIAEDLHDKQTELSELFQDYAAEMDSFLPETDEAASLDFDAAVDELRAKSEVKTSETVQAAETAAAAEEKPAAAPAEEEPETQDTAADGESRAENE